MVKIKQTFDEFIEGTKFFGELISSIVNLILLSFVYFLGFGLTSIIAKLFRKKFIYEKNTKDSYWEELNLTARSFKEYYRQF